MNEKREKLVKKRMKNLNGTKLMKIKEQTGIHKKKDEKKKNEEKKNGKKKNKAAKKRKNLNERKKKNNRKLVTSKLMELDTFELTR